MFLLLVLFFRAPRARRNWSIPHSNKKRISKYGRPTSIHHSRRPAVSCKYVVNVRDFEIFSLENCNTSFWVWYEDLWLRRLALKAWTKPHYGTKLGHFQTLRIHFSTSEGVSEVSERANEWTQWRAWAKRAVRSKQTSEWCKRTSERTSEWPSTYIFVLLYFQP